VSVLPGRVWLGGAQSRASSPSGAAVSPAEPGQAAWQSAAVAFSGESSHPLEGLDAPAPLCRRTPTPAAAVGWRFSLGCMGRADGLCFRAGCCSGLGEAWEGEGVISGWWERGPWPAEETLLPTGTAQAGMHPRSFTCWTVGLHLFI